MNLTTILRQRLERDVALDDMLPDELPAYVHSYVYLFGIATIASLVLVIASGINELDASGEDKVRELALRLRQQDIALMFSSLKKPVAQAFGRTGLLDLLGSENVFPNKEAAIAAARQRYDLAPA